MARSVVLDETLFVSSVEGAGTPGTIGGFTRELRGAMKGAEVTPLPGLDLPRSLEAIMKVAKHYFDIAPALRAQAEQPGGVEAARELAEAVVADGVWLRSLSAPYWLYGWLEAGDAFALLSRVAYDAGDARQSLHWLVAALLVPATILGDARHGMPTLSREDVARLLALQRSLGADAIEEETESWHDLLAGYRLFR